MTQAIGNTFCLRTRPSLLTKSWTVGGSKCDGYTHHCLAPGRA